MSRYSTVYVSTIVKQEWRDFVSNLMNDDYMLGESRWYLALKKCNTKLLSDPGTFLQLTAWSQHIDANKIPFGQSTSKMTYNKDTGLWQFICDWKITKSSWQLAEQAIYVFDSISDIRVWAYRSDYVEENFGFYYKLKKEKDPKKPKRIHAKKAKLPDFDVDAKFSLPVF